jgi:DNA repair exonuclease SbcCD nuclease subunit
MDADGFSRRGFLRLASLGGGAVFASALPGVSLGQAPGTAGFYFVQLSDIHWGYDNKGVNPESRQTLPKTIAAVNALDPKPDFVVFTGDLTQTTDDPKVRRARLREFQELAAAIKVPVRYFAGEHDAALDRGEAYQEVFGATLRYTFDHKGIHFIVLDNTSDPAPILVLTHRPSFSLYPQWDWATRDGQQAIELLMPFPNVTVFYGHIHHEHHHATGHIQHHAARSIMFPLAPLGTAEKKTQVAWQPDLPYAGLGWRSVRPDGANAYRLVEYGFKG